MSDLILGGAPEPPDVVSLARVSVAHQAWYEKRIHRHRWVVRIRRLQVLICGTMAGFAACMIVLNSLVWIGSAFLWLVWSYGGYRALREAKRELATLEDLRLAPARLVGGTADNLTVVARKPIAAINHDGPTS